MKKWDKPELTVLVRSNAEEAVLGTCKNTGLAGPGTPDTHGCSRLDCESCHTGLGRTPCSAALTS